MSEVAIIDTNRYRLALSGTVVPAAEWHNAEHVQALLDRANQALSDARVEAGEQCRKGFERGYADGREAGVAAFARALSALGQARDALTADARGQIAELAIAVVDHIAPKIGAQAMLPALVAEAVQRLTVEPALRVKVHPAVAADVRRCIETLDAAGLPRIDVVDDEELGEFDCVIETQGGLVCAGLQEQLQQAARILAAARSEAEPYEVPDGE